jgi:N-methylhydantoinase A
MIGEPADEWTIGVDIGGTFTDGFAIDNQGRHTYSKVPTTPADHADGALNCIEALADSLQLPVAELLQRARKLAHAQTATVNAMVQRTGAHTGLLATRGFGDTLFIMNVSRGIGLPGHEIGDSLRGQKPDALVPYEATAEVDERIDCDGRIVRPLDVAGARAAIRLLLEQDVEAIAISLLWSFRNPAHEQQLKQLIAELAPRMPTTLSSEIAPTIGEYERTFTAVANAYLAPALDRYVHRLQRDLTERGLKHPVLIMQSNGGLIPAPEAPGRAVTTMSSGLAGGVMGSAFLANALGLDNVISADMGGTSFEVSLILGRQPLISNYPLAARMGPYLWRWKTAVPTIEITAIGSGGGSIARVEDGVLKVGPLSAQADPGPACYGRGGDQPTITDADLVLGYLNPNFFLGGRMVADVEKAKDVIRKAIAEPLGITVVEAAHGIAEVANSQMADLMRNLTVHKGHDPREFHLVAFGGAGPLHVGQFGPALGVKSMVVPGAGMAAAYSALGVALADYRQTFVHSDHLRAPFDFSELESHFQQLEERALRTFGEWGVPAGETSLFRSADVRYSRQLHVVEVPVAAAVQSAADAAAVVAEFERRYEAYYGKGTAVPEAGYEITNLRLTAIGGLHQPQLPSHEMGSSDPMPAFKEVRPIFLRDEHAFQQVPTYDGARLTAGNQLVGPALIEHIGTTIMVQPGQEATIDQHLNCLIRTT